jgi:hypothetical protein
MGENKEWYFVKTSGSEYVTDNVTTIVNRGVTQEDIEKLCVGDDILSYSIKIKLLKAVGEFTKGVVYLAQESYVYRAYEIDPEYDVWAFATKEQVVNFFGIDDDWRIRDGSFDDGDIKEGFVVFNYEEGCGHGGEYTHIVCEPKKLVA